MINFVKLARQLPNALLVVAFFDFLKNLMYVWTFWTQNQYYSSVARSDIFWTVSAGMIERGMGLILYPLGWITTAVTLHLLLAIYDRKVTDNA